MSRHRLRFSPGNTKTSKLQSVSSLQKYLHGGRKVFSLDLLSGYSCPGAKNCMSRAIVRGSSRKIQDGPDTQFRCFSASQEVLYPKVYENRWWNWKILSKLETTPKIQERILKDIPPKCGILRYHVGGDFFSLNYLMAAYNVAKLRPDILFYAYTKCLHFLQLLPTENLAQGIILPNFLITSSRGGQYDELIDKLGVREAKVVFSKQAAYPMKIDEDDSHAATIGPSFALLLHGTQPAGTPAASAWAQLKGKG
jgi:hypothetical protein